NEFAEGIATDHTTTEKSYLGSVKVLSEGVDTNRLMPVLSLGEVQVNVGGIVETKWFLDFCSRHAGEGRSRKEAAEVSGERADRGVQASCWLPRLFSPRSTPFR
ncbi:hypothetical protein ABZ499_35570, partial [Streptomyces sp. NPDC019990]|uniref:hypothetical protein n=1 Tax=Streptomyces sp. NPDC019990 TaxID=3154693 RepID=UPI0033EFBE4D